MAALVVGIQRFRGRREGQKSALHVCRDWAPSPDLLDASHPFSLRRRGAETRFVADETMPRRDPVLPRTLAAAKGWPRDLRAGMSLAGIAAVTGHSEPCIRTRIPLALLGPRLQASILEGLQQPGLSVGRLLRDGIPLDWAGQARVFGTT